MKNKSSFVFACGGSGGHIFPAVAVADELVVRFPGSSITFISTGREIENEIFRTVAGQRVVALDESAKECRGPASKRSEPLWHPSFLLKLAKETKSAVSFLKKEKPTAVVGFGGHGSFPVVVAARFLGIPTVVHEQNVVPGLANRLLARWVDGVALSFSETVLGGRSVCVTGNPIRRAIERDCREEALGFFGFSAEKKTLLVLGGSQGAESVNTLFLDAAPRLADSLKSSIQVLHLCGRMKPEESEKRLAAVGIQAKSYSFFDRMDWAYGASDVAVGRAGATFLAEMEARRLPAILVPYPYAGAHQSVNAAVVACRTGAVVVEQKDLDGAKLAELLTAKLDASTDGAIRGVLKPDEARLKLANFIWEVSKRG